MHNQYRCYESRVLSETEAGNGGDHRSGVCNCISHFAPAGQLNAATGGARATRAQPVESVVIHCFTPVGAKEFKAKTGRCARPRPNRIKAQREQMSIRVRIQFDSRFDLPVRIPLPLPGQFGRDRCIPRVAPAKRGLHPWLQPGAPSGRNAGRNFLSCLCFLAAGFVRGKNLDTRCTAMSQCPNTSANRHTKGHS